MRSWKTFTNLSLLSLVAVSTVSYADEIKVPATYFKAPYIAKLDRSNGMKPVYGVKDVKLTIDKDSDWSSPYAENINDCIMMKLSAYKNDIAVQSLIFTSISEIKIVRGGRPFLGIIGKRVNDASYDEDSKKLTIEFRPEGTPTGPEWCDQGAPKLAMDKIWNIYWKQKGNRDRAIASYQASTSSTSDDKKSGVDTQLIQKELNHAAQDAIGLPQEVNAPVTPKTKPCP
jgi:hypothetical protein